MPTLAVTLTSLQTPAHTFRSTKSVSADVRFETDEAILASSLPAAQGGTDTDVVVALGIPNAAAEIVGLCVGGKSPMQVDMIGPAQTSGSLVSGAWYIIHAFVAGDNFTNVGAGSNATGVIFRATGTTPTTWTNSSDVRRIFEITEGATTRAELNIVGGGANDTVNDGPGDYVWPAYDGHTGPDGLGIGNLSYALVRRYGGATPDDNATDYPGTMAMRLAVYYNGN